MSEARHRLPSVCCHRVGGSQSMHGITCHAAVAFKSAAVKLSATPRAERMLSPVQQLIDAWQHTPCCIAASMSQFWPFSTGPLGWPLSAGVMAMLPWPHCAADWPCQLRPFSAQLSAGCSRLASQPCLCGRRMQGKRASRLTEQCVGRRRPRHCARAAMAVCGSQA